MEYDKATSTYLESDIKIISEITKLADANAGNVNILESLSVISVEYFHMLNSRNNTHCDNLGWLLQEYTGAMLMIARGDNSDTEWADKYRADLSELIDKNS